MTDKKSEDPPIEPAPDTWSSASRQHFIDTGCYLREGEAEAFAAEQP